MAFLKEDELRDALLLVYANKMDFVSCIVGEGAGELGELKDRKWHLQPTQRNVWGWSDGGTGLGQWNAQDNEKVRKETCLKLSCPLCHSSDIPCVSYTSALS